MIYTVFPQYGMPQDFATWQEAKEYAEEELDCEYQIESTPGEII